MARSISWRGSSRGSFRPRARSTWVLRADARRLHSNVAVPSRNRREQLTVVGFRQHSRSQTFPEWSPAMILVTATCCDREPAELSFVTSRHLHQQPRCQELGGTTGGTTVPRTPETARHDRRCHAPLRDRFIDGMARYCNGTTRDGSRGGAWHGSFSDEAQVRLVVHFRLINSSHVRRHRTRTTVATRARVVRAVHVFTSMLVRRMASRRVGSYARQHA